MLMRCVVVVLWRKLRLCPNRVENCAVRPIGTKIAPSPTVAFSNNLKLVLYTPKYPNSNSVIYMLIEGTVVVLWRKLRLLPNQVENCAVRLIGTKIALLPAVAFSNNLKPVLYAPEHTGSNSTICMLMR